MSKPINLLTIEVGGGYEVLESTAVDFDCYEMPEGQELNVSDEIVIISGTLTLSP